jgi:uncharacterized membrane-anchored protein YhcB (DUF1043 family)
MEQLELFPLSDVEVLAKELKKVKESSDNVRRGIFARFDNLAKMYMDLHKKYEDLCITLEVNQKPKIEAFRDSA